MSAPLADAFCATRRMNSPLELLRDLMLGARHSRQTVARAAGLSIRTSDRWLRELLVIPGVSFGKQGKTTWFAWGPILCREQISALLQGPPPRR